MWVIYQIIWFKITILTLRTTPQKTEWFFYAQNSCYENEYRKYKLFYL
jgi:hypothetical protein